ncbi:TPA: hypothetical protein RU529_002579 [Staphylococcus aureus]|nr:hypothetical protein [Staphylococcus aureus]HEA0030395.1 hypothetical protein [Staphylococcus aureus]HEA0051816.1 hypothetical protein [Staphylococcus aureus]HEA0065392.1 hypothetical protein [Staphylococcus aureus]HEA0070775.1 hypothetical protein [Staphylococcus aureus]
MRKTLIIGLIIIGIIAVVGIGIFSFGGGQKSGNQNNDKSNSTVREENKELREKVNNATPQKMDEQTEKMREIAEKTTDNMYSYDAKDDKSKKRKEVEKYSTKKFMKYYDRIVGGARNTIFTATPENIEVFTDKFDPKASQYKVFVSLDRTIYNKGKVDSKDKNMGRYKFVKQNGEWKIDEFEPISLAEEGEDEE